ncbi:GNAT family N-acetyltransferase, partial [Citrobacter braakii]
HHAFSSGAGRTSDGNGSHASTLKSPSYTKSVSWQHYLEMLPETSLNAALRQKLAQEVAHGMAYESRCAMRLMLS